MANMAHYESYFESILFNSPKQYYARAMLVVAFDNTFILIMYLLTKFCMF